MPVPSAHSQQGQGPPGIKLIAPVQQDVRRAEALIKENQEEDRLLKGLASGNSQKKGKRPTGKVASQKTGKRPTGKVAKKKAAPKAKRATGKKKVTKQIQPKDIYNQHG